MKIGFTGSRKGMTTRQRLGLGDTLRHFRDRITEFHHGDCLGADAEAHHIAVNILGADKVHVHPPRDPKMRAFCQSPHILPEDDYLSRDRAIVEASDIVIACPKAGRPAPRSGTWYTIRYAQKSGVRVSILEAV